MALGDAARLRSYNPAGTVVAIGDGRSPCWSPLHQNVDWLWQAPNPPANVKWVISHPGNRPYCDYDRMIREARSRFGWPEGKSMDGRQAFQLIRRKFWRKDYRPTPAPIVLTEAERAFGVALVRDLRRPLILVEPNLKTGAAENKRWPFDRYQELVKSLRREVTFLQFGEPLLDGALKLPPMPVRRAVAVISKLDGYLGAEGGLHHSAAAVGLPGVVIFGGYINPSVTGYPSHHNLFVECGDEGVPGPTPSGQAALAAISVEEVTAALEMVLLETGE